MGLLREASTADLPALLDIYNDAVLNTTAVYDTAPRDFAAQARWLEAKREQDWPVLVVEIDGLAQGFASFGPFRPWPAYLHSVENSIYIAPHHRGRGLGTALLGALLERAKQRNHHVMVAAIDAANDASIKLHRRFGFEPAGHLREIGWKFERWLDLLFLQRILV